MKQPLLITYEYLPQHGGIAKYLEQEVKNFEEDKNHQVRIIHAQDYEMPLWPQWLPLVWRVRKYLVKGFRIPNKDSESLDAQCNSIWISHILPIGYIALIYKKLFKIPYRVYLHGLDLVRPKKSKWKSFWVRKILNNADKIICNSKATAQLLEYYDVKFNGSMGVSHLKIQHPRVEKVSAKNYLQSGINLRKKYNLENKKILLTVSRLVKRKGIDLVICALPVIWKQIPGLVYVVIGDGEERDNLRVIAKECIHDCGNPALIASDTGLTRRPEYRNPRNDSIIFTGAVSDEEKYGWLSTCNCFILTPRDDPNDFEGYGIVYKEAQMFNKPVIGSKVGGVTEAVGDDGVLVEPGDVEEITRAILLNTK